MKLKLTLTESVSTSVAHIRIWGVESLSEPKEVWFFKRIRLAGADEDIGDAYAKNVKLTAALEQIVKRKNRLNPEAANVFATYREDQSRGAPWGLGRGNSW